VPPSQFDARLVENRTLRGGYFTLELEALGGPSPLRGVLPGQFVMLRGQWGRELLNPRAFSVLHADGDRFSVLLKVFGRGTARMHEMRPGDTMTVTGPLGRAFPPPSQASSRPSGSEGRTQLLVAGGVGLPPLHLQARMAAGQAARVELLYGGRNADDLVLLEDFERWRVPMHLATEDGSLGTRGFVTVALQARLDAAQRSGEDVEILSCGPTPMLKAVREIGLQRNVPTFLCLEEEMACGFGVCLGCAVPVYGEKPYRYCCTDGPVFDAREVRW
jgi:dihydroorotate dehydrogenase electron transfer subunit